MHWKTCGHAMKELIWNQPHLSAERRQFPSASAYAMLQKAMANAGGWERILRLQHKFFAEMDSGKEYEWTLIKNKWLFWGAFGKMKGKQGISMETETEKSESKSRWAGLLSNGGCFLWVHLRHGTDLLSLMQCVVGSWCVLGVASYAHKKCPWCEQCLS